MQAPRRTEAPPGTTSAGLVWLLGALHEIVHAHAGPVAACLFLPVDASPEETGDATGGGLCPAMDRDTSSALLSALSDAGIEVAEQLEPARLMAPGVAGHEHVLTLPLARAGQTAGVLVVAAPTPPLGRAGLSRVAELADRGLAWVTDASDTAVALDALHQERTRLDSELTQTRMFLELQERLVAAGTTGDVVTALASWLDAGVAVQMPTLIVAEAAGAGARGLALSPGRSEAEQAVIDRTGTAELPVLPAGSRMPARAVAPLTRGDSEFAGFLIAGIGPRGTDATRRALRVSQGLISYQMAVRQDIEASVATLRQTVLTDLLAGGAGDDLATRAAKLGHDLSVPHIPVAVGRAGGGALGADADRLLRIVGHTGSSASAAGTTSLVGVIGDMVVAFVPEPLPGGGLALARSVAAEAESEGLAVVVGVGPRTDSVSCMPGTGARARWAVQVLAATRKDGAPRAADFDSLGIYGLLFDHRRAEDLVAFARAWLGPLVEYDRRHRSELVETLRHLFRQRSLTDAAAALHIHISTLKYRVGRIEDILGRSVDCWDNVFHLELALRILAVDEHLRPPAE